MVQESKISKTNTEKKLSRQERLAYTRLRSEALAALGEYRRQLNNFDYICEEKLVDVSVYDIQKSMSRYEYLLDEMKRIYGAAEHPETPHALPPAKE